MAGASAEELALHAQLRHEPMVLDADVDAVLRAIDSQAQIGAAGVSAGKEIRGLRMSLPATSANLGPGFDAAGLALSMRLTIEAKAAVGFQIQATGRDAELCGALEQQPDSGDVS